MQYHNTLDALVYDHTAAENYALYVQAFALARLRLRELLRARGDAGANPASYFLVSDLDETLLDSTPYRAWLVATGRDFHMDTWNDWCRAEASEATPGALAFIRHAATDLGIGVCYVSSRQEVSRAETAANVVGAGFPLPDASADPARTHLFLAGMELTPGGGPTTKREQYAHLKQRFGAEPLLHLGDNLSDHDPVLFSSKLRHDQRAENARLESARWGVDRIVFPNPVYGSWRDSLKLVSGGGEQPITDEAIPAPYQAAPVRPALTSAAAPKLATLPPWSPPPGP